MTREEYKPYTLRVFNALNVLIKKLIQFTIIKKGNISEHEVRFYLRNISFIFSIETGSFLNCNNTKIVFRFTRCSTACEILSACYEKDFSIGTIGEWYIFTIFLNLKFIKKNPNSTEFYDMLSRMGLIPYIVDDSLDNLILKMYCHISSMSNDPADCTSDNWSWYEMADPTYNYSYTSNTRAILLTDYFEKFSKTLCNKCDEWTNIRR